MKQTEHELLSEEASFVFHDPFTGDPGDLAYSAMPGNPFRDQATIDRQGRIETSFQALFEHPPLNQGISDAFRDMLLEDHLINDQRRKMVNHENYMAWRVCHPVVENFEDVLAEYETGRADPTAALQVALHEDTGDIQGLEVGRVLHPYWRRMEHVPVMRQEVAQAISAFGGVLEPRVAPYRSIDITPRLNQKDIVGFIGVYKHDIGFIPRPDGKILRVVERQVAGYRTDPESGFRQDILDKMYAIAAEKQDFDWANIYDDRFMYHFAGTGCRGFIEKAIQTDSTEDFVVPISTTVYCYPETPEDPLHKDGIIYRAPDKDDGIAYYSSPLVG